jgi:2'-5' RNA ligase
MLANHRVQDCKRLFVALPLPLEMLDLLGQVQRQLRKLLSGEEVRWCRPDQMHLTLKFLGNVDATQVDILQEALSEGSSRHAPLLLRSGKVGCFPDFHRPKVLWMGIEGTLQQLEALHQFIDRATQGFGDHAEDRPFRPHLTLGRIKLIQPDAARILENFLGNQPALSQIQWASAYFELIQSLLKPEGAVYQTLGRFSLSGVCTQQHP